MSAELQICSLYGSTDVSVLADHTIQNFLEGREEVILLAHLPAGHHGSDAVTKTSLFPKETRGALSLVGLIEQLTPITCYQSSKSSDFLPVLPALLEGSMLV